MADGVKARRKVSYEARTAMLNGRNQEARGRRGKRTGPLVWCEPRPMPLGMTHAGGSLECPRCGPRKGYVGARRAAVNA